MGVEGRRTCRDQDGAASGFGLGGLAHHHHHHHRHHPPPSGWEGWPRSPMVIVEQTDQDLITQLAKMVKAGLAGRSLGLTCTPASLF